MIYIDDETLSKMKRRARDPETGEVELIPATMTYEEWSKQQFRPMEEYRKRDLHRSSDRNQYEAYRSLLGREAPRSFLNFQTVKYENSVEYAKLKRDVSDKQLQKRLAKDDVRKKLHEGRQGKHISGHNNYKEGKSPLFLTMEECEKIVQQKAGTGKIIRDKRGRWRNMERVELDRIIGHNNGEPTDSITIRYSKDGAHIVPSTPSKKVKQ